jgi:ubiquinone biosynthesis protein
VTTVWNLILIIAAFIVFAWAVRRALGVERLAVWRIGVAALVGVVVTALIVSALVDRGSEDDAAALVGLALGLVGSMVAIVVMEALSASRPERHTTNPVSATMRRVRQGTRSLEIARIASKHGLKTGIDVVFGDDLATDDEATYADALRATLEEAGGVFVKLGQVLANHPELLPDGVASRLATLQSDVRPEPRAVLEPAIVESLGAPIDSLFDSFDWDPIGAASIGQVHAAVLQTGERVVVKVQRPKVRSSIERDLDIILDLADAAEHRSDDAKKLGVSAMAQQFAKDLRSELDFRIEARNTHEIGSALSDDTMISVPKVYDQFTTETLLVLEFMEGTPLVAMQNPIPDGRSLADDIFSSEVHAMLAGDRFHADPHPGNVLLRPDGGLALVDFGSAGKLDTYERAAVTDILTALALNDPSLLRSATMQVATSQDDVDPAQLDRAFARLMADRLGPGAEPSSEMLRDFLAVATRFGLAMPASVSQMLRALVTLQSTIEVLSPGYPIVGAATDMASSEIAEVLSPENLSSELKREIVRLAPILRQAPYHLDRIAGQIESGNIGFKASFFSDERDVRVISRLINRLVLTFVAGILGIVSVLLFSIDSTFSVTANISLFDLLGFVGLLAGAVLIMRVVLEVFSER